MTTKGHTSNPRKRANSMAGMVLGALAGAVIGFAIAFAFLQLERSLAIDLYELSPLVLAISLIGGVLLALFAHELGHLAAGMLGGMRPLLLVVGPLRVQREGGRLRVGFNRSLALAGGLAACVPPDDRNLRRRMAWMIAGGPVASLLLAGAGAGLFMLLPSGTLGAIGLITAFLSSAICLVTLVPLRSGGFNSDGARLLMLARGGPTVDRYLANLALVSSSLGGIRPRDWNPALVERAQALPDESIDHRSAQLMAYSYMLDQGSIEQAGTHLDHILAHLDAWPAPFRPALLLEGAFYMARHRQQTLQARQLLDQAGSGGTLVAPATRLSAKATVLLAEGRTAEATATAEQGIQALDRTIDAGAAIVERERLEAVITGYNRASPPGS